MLEKSKHIAVYQAQPASAVPHYALVDRIEPYGESGKYKLIFTEKAQPLGSIPYGDAPLGASMQDRSTLHEL